MRTLHGLVLLAGFSAIACGGATAGASKPIEDASTSSGESGGTASSTDGSTTIPDASSLTDAAPCGNALVSNVVQGGASAVPSDGCGSLGAPTAPTCVGPPVTFSCPVVRGPGDSGTIRPGDPITVSVVAMSDGSVNYPCFGLVADHGVTGGATALYALPATGWEFAVQIPASLNPGTVVHFTAYVRSSSSLNAGTCPNRLGKLDFDVTVG